MKLADESIALLDKEMKRSDFSTGGTFGTKPLESKYHAMRKGLNEDLKHESINSRVSNTALEIIQQNLPKNERAANQNSLEGD